MNFFLLYLLAISDSLLAGYRAVAGRNALIHKTRYYQRAMWSGVKWVQVAVLVAAALGGGLLWTSDSPRELFREYDRMAGYLLPIYLPYALVVFATFAIRAIPSVDIRSATSVLGFGPLTLLRPVVIYTGAARALWHVHPWQVVCISVVVLAMMMLMESFLRWKIDPETIKD